MLDPTENEPIESEPADVPAGGWTSLPPISRERVEELARKGTAIDGHVEDVDPAKNARVKGRGYERETPPMPAKALECLAKQTTIKDARTPSLYYLWNNDRVVFVGKTRTGVCNPTIAAHIPEHARLGTITKEFDTVTLQPCPEDVLDAAVGAIVRYLRPKYNRKPKPVEDDVRERDLKLLQLLELA
jgi:hypothetical protein